MNTVTWTIGRMNDHLSRIHINDATDAVVVTITLRYDFKNGPLIPCGLLFRSSTNKVHTEPV